MFNSQQWKASIKRHIRDKFPDWFIVIRAYRKKHGRWPSILKPTTFNEKVLCRILFDRRPVLTQMADKAAVRCYVQSRLGGRILPICYHLTSNPATIPFDDLPDRFVIKATHGSGFVHVVPEKSTINRGALIEKCNSWLLQSYYHGTREWAYRNIEPKIIVEQFIDDGTGGVPNDYKLFVFDGIVEVVQVDCGRFIEHRRSLFTTNWQKIDVISEFDNILGEMARPAHLEEMIAAAQALGSGMDFIRADFYDTPEQLYFGELTTTPGCAYDRFCPVSFDHDLGRRWKMRTR